MNTKKIFLILFIILISSGLFAGGMALTNSINYENNSSNIIEISNLKDDLKESQLNVKGLEIRLDEAKEKYVLIENELKVKEEELNLIQGDYSSLQVNYAQLLTDYNNLLEEKAELEQVIVDLQEQINSIAFKQFDLSSLDIDFIPFYKSISDTEYLIDSGKGFYIYDLTDNSMELISDISFHTQYCEELSSGDFILTSSSGWTYSTAGVLYFSVADRTITLIYDTYSTIKDIYEFENGDYLFASSSDRTNSSGLLYFESETKEVTKVYNLGYYWTNFFPVANGKVLITSSYYSDKPDIYGVLLFDFTDRTTTKIFDSYYQWKYGCVLPNGNCLISSMHKRGVLLYDSENETITQYFDSVVTFKFYGLLSNGDCLLGSGDYDTVGIYLYKSADNSISKIYDEQRSPIFYSLNNGNCLITSSYSSQKLLLYNAQDNTISSLANLSNTYTHFLSLDEENIVFICSNSNSGHYYFDITTNELVSFYVSGRIYAEQKLENGDYLLLGIYENASNSTNYLYYFDIETRERSLITSLSITGFDDAFNFSFIEDKLVLSNEIYTFEYNNETNNLKLLSVKL